MAVKFFGHYLIDEGKLTKEQLIDVADYQAKHNLSLGEWAIKADLITKKDAQKINDMQQSMDKRFGEVAKELGLLNENQIDVLISKQKGMRVFFGEAVVLKGYMSKEQLDENLKAFEVSQKVQLDKIDKDIKQIDKNGLIKDSIEVLQKIYFRIIHDNIKLTDVSINEDIKRDGLLSMQKMRGDEHMDFALQCIDEVTLNIATTYLKMPFNTIDDDAADALSEFVNVVLGNIAVHLSDKEERVNLTPPQVIDKNDFNYNEFYCFDFTTTKGDLTLCIKI
ncbi:MAG: chemotaxis protein CheX [Campylobacterota bacterium]|nr:chemotaxis protein CheX [Campylobacterota bacterium]